MSHDELKKDFQKCVERAAGHRHVVDVFGDMVRAMAIAIESPFTIGERNEELEREYAAIKARYTAAEFQEFPKALAITGTAIELKREDFLGHALEALGASNTRNGQFLTPVCVSRMMAALLYPKLDDYTPGKIIKLNDPSCGAAFMPRYGSQVCCSDECRAARHRRLTRKCLARRAKKQRLTLAAERKEKERRRAEFFAARDAAFEKAGQPVPKIEERGGVRIESRGTCVGGAAFNPTVPISTKSYYYR